MSTRQKYEFNTTGLAGRCSSNRIRFPIPYCTAVLYCNVASRAPMWLLNAYDRWNGARGICSSVAYHTHPHKPFFYRGLNDTA